jgi:AraC family transcriptional regulator
MGMDYIQGLQNAIAYIEDNIAEELDYGEIAKRAYISNFQFQRAFSILCGFTLGEYIRNRRLTLAGMELSSGGIKVIDIAAKYGYDSPDSFTKAFSRFHGISPSSAKKEGARLKSFAPLKIKFILEGANLMEYKIETKKAFKVIGTEKEYNMDTAFAEIPKFWGEHFQSGNGKYICGMFGINYGHDSGSGTFNYMIADCAEGKGEVPSIFTTKEIPAKTWAIFPIKGAVPEALQEAISKVWSEWLPNCREYEMDGDINIEMYSAGDTTSPDYYCELWLPVKKK